MKSQREVERRYKSIVDYYERTEPNPTPKVNCYKCYCGHITKTVDINAGVTPFKHKCEKCPEYATSTMYEDIAPNKIPTQQWYRPTLKQAMKMRKNPELLEHILQGGLDNKAI